MLGAVKRFTCLTSNYFIVYTVSQSKYKMDNIYVARADYYHSLVLALMSFSEQLWLLNGQV